MPWLTTLPPRPEKASLPSRKSASLMFMAEATRPCTSTCAVPVKITPAGLTRNTLPLACRAPAMVLALPPVTRLRAAAELPGCTKRTVSAEPMSKPSYSMTALALAWLMVSVSPFRWNPASPRVTRSPRGNAKAG